MSKLAAAGEPTNCQGWSTLQSLVHRAPVVKVHRRPVRGAWVGSSVAAVLEQEWRTPAYALQAGSGSAVEGFARACADGDVWVEAVAAKRSSDFTATASQNVGQDSSVLSSGIAVLAHTLDLRQILCIRTRLLEPAVVLPPQPRSQQGDAQTPLFAMLAIYPGSAFAKGSSEALESQHLVIAVDKPASVPAHPGGRFHAHSVQGLLALGAFRLPLVDAATEDAIRAINARTRRQLGLEASAVDHEASTADDGRAIFWRPCHRLDRGTSGVMFLASSSVTANAVARLVGTPPSVSPDVPSPQAFDDGGARKRKTYLACVVGQLAAPLVCDHALPLERALPPADGKPVRRLSACTRFTPRARRSLGEGTAAMDVTVVECELLHGGRQHQVRQHAAALGHPILGDTLYGPNTMALGLHVFHAGAWVDEGSLGAWLLDVQRSTEDNSALTSDSALPSDRDEGAAALLLLHAAEYGFQVPALSEAETPRVIHVAAPPPFWATRLLDE